MSILAFGMEGSSPLEVFHAVPAKQEPKALGPKPRITIRKLDQLQGQSSVLLELKFLGFQD